MRRVLLSGLVACLLAACAPMPPQPHAAPELPTRWAEQDAAAASAGLQSEANWWRTLADATLDQLVEAATASSPSLNQSLAKVAEARALADGQDAAQTPQLSGSVSASRGNSDTSPPRLASRAGPGLMLSWEVDLWGRIANNRAAAGQKLQMRQAEHELARLVLEAQVLDTALAERACRRQLEIKRAELDSLLATASLFELRVSAGSASGAQLARTQANAAEAQGSLARSHAQCRQLRHALVALTGLPPAQLEQLLARAPASLPTPPQTRLALPAVAVLAHPQVRAALAAADAAYYEAGAARAARLPSLSLSALLSHQWVRAMGTTAGQDIWSLGSSLTGALFDGGAGAAKVGAAAARQEQALAALQQSLRATVQEIESALAQLEGARRRHAATQRGMSAAEQGFAATTASFGAGRVSRLELEDARRLRLRSEVELLNASREASQAWGALVKAAGNAPGLASVTD